MTWSGKNLRWLQLSRKPQTRQSLVLCIRQKFAKFTYYINSSINSKTTFSLVPVVINLFGLLLKNITEIIYKTFSPYKRRQKILYFQKKSWAVCKLNQVSFKSLIPKKSSSLDGASVIVVTSYAPEHTSMFTRLNQTPMWDYFKQPENRQYGVKRVQNSSHKLSSTTNPFHAE